ncbi:hypothetical protein HYPSUDRAFT_199940, partial [Hypholoma sublateritium FD-334 SS-4]
EYLEPEPGTPPHTEDVAAYHVWLYENVVKGTIKAHLDGIRDEAHAEPNTVYRATDASVPAEKKYQALAGFALFQGDERVDSARYVSGKVLAPETELSAIRFAIVRATQVPGCTRIVIFTDHIASAKKALDPSVHSGQGHSLAVCRTLLVWFAADPLNTLEFYDCPSKADPGPSAQDDLGFTPQFLQLLDLDDNLIKPSYLKGRSWIPAAKASTSLVSRMTRAILGHAPIGEYYSRFLPDEDPACPCGEAALETRDHILNHCRRRGVDYYYRPARTLPALIHFLERFPWAFSFRPKDGVG